MRITSLCLAVALIAAACKQETPGPNPTPVPTEWPTEVATEMPTPEPVGTPVPNPNPCKFTGPGADGKLWKGDCEPTAVCHDLGGGAFVGDCHTKP